MRIDCESCGAAYAIDDNLIGDRGVRAQCPRCGTQKVVKKPAAGPAADPFGGAAPAAPSDPFAQTMAPNPFGGAPAGAAPSNPFSPPAAPAPNPFGGAPAAAAPNPFGAAPANPFGGAPAPNPFGGGGPAPNPFGGAPAASAPPPNPFAGAPGGDPFAATGAPAANPYGGGAAPNPFGGAAAGAPPNPFAAPAAAPAPNPFGGGGNPFEGQPAAPAPDPFAASKPADPFPRQGTGTGGGASPFVMIPPGGAAPAGAPAPGNDPFGGSGGGAPDPFANIGSGDGGGSARGGGAAPPDGKEWSVRVAGGKELGPLTLDEVRQKVKAGEITKEAQASQNGGPFRPITGFAPLAVSFRGGDKATQKVVYRQSGGSRAVGMVAGLLVVGGLGGAAFVYKDRLLSSEDAEQENIFRRRAQTWKLQYPDLDGTAEDHLRKGQAFFREDTALGYRLGHEELTKALCLDPDNTETMGAYVENFSLLPQKRADESATRDALEGIEFAIKRNPRRAALFRAKGALMIKLERVEEAQGALNQALQLDSKDALAKIYLAQTNLERNVVESIRLTEEASRLDPTLSRASYVLGLAHQKQGRFKTALNHFMSRLRKDPEHQATLLAIARLFVEVGDFQQAQQNLEKLLQLDARNHEARLMLAKVLYQGLRDFRRAEGQLAELAASLGQDGAEIARDVYTHHAFVLGERGKWKEAEDAINLALKDDPQHGPALYVAGRVLLHRGAAAEAREKLEKAAQIVQNTFREAPVRTALADVLRQQGLLQEAVRAYTTVIRNDARYIRAYLGVASMYAEAGNMQQAAAMMREVLDIDPFHRVDHFYFTDYPETPHDTEEYRVGWTKVKPGENDRSIVLSSEGITAFHSEQLDDAERLLKRALADDRNNHAAAMYLGAAYLQKKRGKDAVSALTDAARINNLHVRTMYLLARAYELSGDEAKAEKTLGNVRDADGNFVAAVNALGELAMAGGQDERAKDYFLDAFKADQDFTPAKRNLLKCGY